MLGSDKKTLSRMRPISFSPFPHLITFQQPQQTQLIFRLYKGHNSLSGLSFFPRLQSSQQQGLDQQLMTQEPGLMDGLLLCPSQYSGWHTCPGVHLLDTVLPSATHSIHVSQIHQSHISWVQRHMHTIHVMRILGSMQTNNSIIIIIVLF